MWYTATAQLATGRLRSSVVSLLVSTDAVFIIPNFNISTLIIPMNVLNTLFGFYISFLNWILFIFYLKINLKEKMKQA